MNRIGSKILFIFFLILFLGTKHSVFSQNAISSGLYGTFNFNSGQNNIYYCITDGEDILTAVTPVGGSFVNVGASTALYSINNATSPTTARINPSTLAVGIYNFKFNGKDYFAHVELEPTVTLDPLPDQCQNVTSFNLAPYSDPPGGTFSGTGVTGTVFNPSAAGAGSTIITYTYPVAGCSSSDAQLIVVNALPVITFNPISTVCINSAPFNLTHATPAGGTYLGTGVSGGVFTPSVAGVGTHTITYIYSSGGCTSSATQTVTVSALPVVSFTGLDTLYCDSYPADILTGSVAGGGIGTFTGNGITDNANGTANFDPSTSGLGYHTITYSYTNPSGCFSSYSRLVRVGTLLTFSGLNSSFCLDDPNNGFSYNPVGGSFTALAGLTDNLDGTALFSPSASGAGSKTVRYTLVDENACVNILDQNVTINPLPVVNFSGLNTTGYCVNGSSALLTGSRAPSGTFSGPGITDNGNGTATFNPTTLPVGGPYSITYSYTDGVTGCSNSISKTTNILPLPLGVISGTQTICYGSTANLDVDFTGTGPYNFTYNNGVGNIPVTGVADPYILTVSPTASATYTLVSVTQANGCSNTGSGSATVTVNALSTIVTHPVNKTVCPGDNVTFSVSATGTGLTYQWQLNTVPIAGETNNVLNINNVDATDAGSYRCIVSSTCGTPLTSSVATLTVLTQTSITTQPTDKTICQGNNTNFYVVSAGIGLTYQWKRNGVDLTNVAPYSGTGTDNLVITSAALANAGAFTCLISGTCGNATTNPAVLVVNENIVITTQPVNKSICPGLNTSFTVAVTGTNPTYQWQKNNVNIAGATNPTLTLSSVNSTHAGSYKCIITGTCGTVTSNLAQLTVFTDVSISTQPSDVSICEGTDADFNVVASGSNLSFQWKKDGVNLTDVGAYSGTGTDNLTVTGAVLSHSGIFTCTVTGTCGNVTTNAAELTVNENLVLTTQPVSKSVCPGTNTSFSVAVTGTNPVYQWQKNNVNIAGATNPTLTLSSVNSTNAGTYKCIINGTCGTVTSNQVTLVVYTDVSILTQPSDYSACEGTNANFNVIAAGSNLIYQWRRNGVDLSNVAPYSGTSTDNLVITGAALSHAGSFTCYISGTCGNVTTNATVLTVNENIVITTQPVGKSVCPGTNTSLSVAVTGTNPTYQWQKNNVNILGATEPNLIFSSVNAADNGNYKCIITGTCGTVTSVLVQLVVYTNVSISLQPSSYSTCEGATANFNVAAAGSNLTYKWQRNDVDLVNGANISGATSANLALTNLTTGSTGGYACVVTGSCGTVKSTTAQLRVDASITITSNPPNDTACLGDNVVFTTVATGSNLTYQWVKDGINIPGENNNSLVLTSAGASDVGLYYCTVSNACTPKSTSIASFSLFNQTSIITQPANFTACAGTNASFSTTTTGSNRTYQWTLNGAAISDTGKYTGSGTRILSINAMNANYAGIYLLQVSGSCGNLNSDPALLTVNENILISAQPTSKTVCPGTNVNFSVTASGTNLTYQWQLNGINIIGETNSSLALSSVDVTDAGSYRCLINGTCGSVTTSSATLTLLSAISISANPVSQQICEGNNVNFTVSASGSNLNYQWRKNGVNVAGATTPILSINNVTLADAAAYSCNITNSCGTNNSTPANLTVNPLTDITTQPVTFYAVDGGNASFSIEAVGDNLTYQWYKTPGTLLTNSGVYSGVTTSILTLSGLDASHAGSYYCFVNGTCGSENSNPGLLIRQGTAIIDQHPSDPGPKCVNNTVNFDITLEVGVTVISYQWKKDGIDLIDDGRINGSTTLSLTISPLTVADAGTYSCFVTANEGFENSFPANLTVSSLTDVTLQPLDGTKCEGDNAIFAITAAGNSLVYKWRKNGIPISDLAGKISGSDSPLLSISVLTVSDADVYYCVVTGQCNNDNSDPATLIVNQNTLITDQPDPLVKCTGTSATFSVSADGGNLTYQWKKDGVNLNNLAGKISGATTKDLTISNIALSDQGNYSCEVTGTCGSENSLSASLTVNAATSISIHPQPKVKCEDEDAVFFIEATGSNLAYQWKRNGTPLVNDGVHITGANTSILIIRNLVPADGGNYLCFVTGDCGSDQNSDVATMTVNPKVQIITNPSDVTKCNGLTASFSVTATGANLVYQWKKDGVNLSDVAPYSGSNTDKLDITGTTVSEAGVYTCFISGTCGSLTSDPAILTVNENIVITSQPVSKTICPGNNTSFNVAVTGSNPGYQWKKNNVDIAGATSPTLFLSSVDATDMGSYRCLITGTCGTVQSLLVQLTVPTDVSISLHPTNFSTCEGTTANFNVSATGSGLNFRWQYNGSNIIDGANITGATSPGLAINNLLPANAGGYACVVSGTCGTITSNTALLSVDASITITTNPSSYAACRGENVIFTTVSTGSNLVYQWVKNGTNMPGENNNNLVLSSVGATDVTSYFCRVSNACGPKSTSSASLTLNDSTVILTQPVDVTNCAGANASFTVTATGSNLSYQWILNGLPVSDTGRYAGSNTNKLSISSIAAEYSGIYQCRVNGSCGNLNTNAAFLTVNENIVITGQPVSKSICPGNNTSFSVTVTGSNLTYQWQKNNVNILGATSPTLILSSVGASDMETYKCIINGTCGTTISDPVQLTVHTDVSISLHPSSYSTCQGTNASFNVGASGSGLNFQWQFNGSNVINDLNISGATSPNLSINNLLPANSGGYACVVSGNCGTLTSNTAVLSVDANITITSNPANSAACPGDNVIFSTNATGSNLAYQWVKGIVNIPGENINNLVLSAVDATDVGSYFCKVTNACGTKSTSIANLTLNNPTVIVTQPANVTECAGVNASFVVSTTGSNLSYQWTFNGLPVSDTGRYTGSVTSTLSITNIDAEYAGIYQCQVNGSCGNINTEPAFLTVNENILITTQPTNKTACNGTDVNFSVTATGTGLTYQWQLAGVNIAGAQSNTLLLSSVDASDAGLYRCLITGNCGIVFSNAANLNILSEVLISGNPVSQQLCEGNSVSFSVTATGTNLLYQWRKNGTDMSDGGRISGTKTSILAINNVTSGDVAVYSCYITNSCGINNSLPASLAVYPTTVITTQPTAFQAVENGNASFSVAVTGENLTYQWFRNGVMLSDGGVYSGATTSILTLTGLNSSHAGSYFCMVNGTCGSTTSNPGSLQVNLLTLITSHPVGPVQKCFGESVGFNVIAGGTNLTYQWKKDGINLVNGLRISGSTTSNLSINNLVITDAGSYSCLVSGSEGSENSFPASLTVSNLTNVTLHPIDSDNCEGDDAIFVITASGDNLVYLWQKDGVNLSNGGRIAGADSPVLSVSDLVVADGGVYNCFVTGICGNDNSDPATLIVNQNTLITAQPASLTLCTGNPATFSVTASGGNLTYQWKRNGVDLVNGGNISGTTSKDLTIANILVSNQGAYSCVVSGSCGSQNSLSATLTVSAATMITLHPQDQVKCEDDDAFFTVEANGSGLTFEWQKNGTPLVDDGIHITGATTSILIISDLVPADGDNYQCFITGTCGGYLSDAAELIINSKVQILSNPSGATKCLGETVKLSVLSLSSTDTYQWKKDGSNVTDGGNYSGSTTPNLNISNINGANAGIYSCLVSGLCDSQNSGLAAITVQSTTEITLHPLQQSVDDGTPVTFTINATGDNLVYQWQRNGANLSDGANITGTASSVLSINSASTLNSGAYTCAVTGSCGMVVSDPANLTVNVATVILTHPVNQTICEGLSAVFKVTATGVNLKYQWRKNGSPVSNLAGKISGSATQNLTISPVSITDVGVYTCAVSGDGGSLNSTAATLNVNTSTTLVSQSPSVQVKCAGENTYFAVTVTGNNLSYAWEKDGIPLADGVKIDGSDNDILTVSDLSSTSDNGVYRCMITGTCGTISSDPSSLFVNELPGTAGVITGSTTLCQGETTKAYEVPQISNATTYEWLLPYGVTITSGADSRHIVVNYAIDALGGIFTVNGRNSCGAGPASAPLSVTVNPKPVADAGFDQNLCSTSSVLEGNNTSNGSWFLISGFGTISNTGLYNSAISNLGKGNNILMWTVTENNCTSRDTVVLTNNIVTVNAGQDQVLCANSTILDAATPTVGTGNWSIVSGGANFVGITNPKSSLVNIVRGTNILKWSVNNNSCISSDTVSITNDLPTNSFAGTDTILLTNSYVLAGNTPTIGTGIWTLVNGSGILADPLSPTSSVSNLSIGENIFKWTITNKTCYNEDEVTVLNYTPTVTDAGVNQTLCSDQTQLMGTKPTYGTGQWSVVAGSGNFIDARKFDTNVTNIGKGQNIYRWTIYEYKTTFDSVVIINNSPTTPNAGIDRHLCLTQTQLSGNIPIVGSAKWTIIGGSATITNDTQFNTTVSNLSNGANTFRWTLTNGTCILSDEVNIFNDQPSNADAGVDQTTCADSVTLYPNSPSIGTGEWSVVSGSAGFFGNKAKNLAIEDNLLKWTISNFGCLSSDTVKITSHKPTQSSTPASKSICVDSIQLAGNTPVYGTGLWTILNGSAVLDNPANPKTFAKDLASGLNRFRWTITYKECSSYSDANISYDFIQADAGPGDELCSNSASLAAGNPQPGTGFWRVIGGSGSAGFTNSSMPNTVVNKLDLGTNTLRWTVTNAGCISYDEITIVNNSPSTSNAGTDRTVCGESIFLNGNNPLVGTGIWVVIEGSANILTPEQNNSEIINLSLGKNTLRWIIENEGCISSDEIIINNKQPTDIDAGLDQYICFDSTDLFASEPADGGYGRWSIASGSATFNDNTLYNTRVRNLEKGENILVWTVTIAGCSNYDTVHVANNLPSIPSSGPDQDICASETFMAANLPQIGTGKWGVVSGSASFVDPFDPYTKVSNAGNGSNQLRWTITNGSCYLYDEMNLINSLPTLAYAGEDRAVCGNTASLLANYPIIGTGMWKVASGFGIIDNPTEYTTQISSLGFGSNTLRWTTENGRCRTSDDVIITNNLSVVDAGLDKVVYLPVITLVGNKPASGLGEWKQGAGTGNIETPGNFETKVTNLGQGANTFTWTINKNGCEATDEVSITYYILPVVEFIPTPQSGCPSLQVDFTNASIGGNPFTWDFGDSSALSFETNPSHTYNFPGEYIVTLTGTGPDGILIKKDTTIIVREQPDAELDITPAVLYISTPPSELDEPLHCFALTTGVESVIWDFGDGTTSTEINPLHRYQITGVFDVTLTVITGYQCIDSETKFNAVTVERKGRIEFPNAFTPNMNGPTGGVVNPNDYSNDVFHGYGEDLLDYHLEIYNRFGIVLFKSDDINIGWDGYFKGKLVEEGVYVYRISGKYNNGESFSEIGSLIIIYSQ